MFISINVNTDLEKNQYTYYRVIAPDWPKIAISDLCRVHLQNYDY